MQIFDNINRVLKDDLWKTIVPGRRLSIAAACFSIYAYGQLKKQLDAVRELRFIFTSPTFVAEKSRKEKREFYIPRLNRDAATPGRLAALIADITLAHDSKLQALLEVIREKITAPINPGNKKVLVFTAPAFHWKRLWPWAGRAEI